MRGIQQRDSALPIEGERLLCPDVLAGGKNLQGDLDVHLGNREIDDNLDLIILQQLFDAPKARNSELLGLRLRTVEIDIGDEPHVEIGEAGEILEVLPADHSGANHANADGPCALGHARPSFVR